MTVLFFLAVAFAAGFVHEWHRGHAKRANARYRWRRDPGDVLYERWRESAHPRPQLHVVGGRRVVGRIVHLDDERPPPGC